MGKTKNRLLVVLLVAISVAGIVLPATRVTAATQGGFNLTTTGTPVLLTAAPGSTVTTDLRVVNTGTQPERLHVSLMKFGASGETGRPNLFDRGPGDSYFDWVSFNPTNFDAPPGQWITVKMKIVVPKSASLGYYYAATFERAKHPTSRKGSSLIGASATLVLLEVKTPHEKRSMGIAEFSTDHHVYQYLPTTFNLRVHNTGNIHLSPGGNIFIKRGNHVIATLDVNKFQGNVLPHSYRAFSAEWTDGFPKYVDKQVNGKPLLTKAGKPDRSLQWNFGQLSHLRFGHYTAQALVVYNDGQHDIPLQKTVSFWVIPWAIIIVVLLLLLLIGAGLWAIGHGTWRRTRLLRRK